MSVRSSEGLRVYMCGFMRTCICVNGIFMNACFAYESVLAFPTA